MLYDVQGSYQALCRLQGTVFQYAEGQYHAMRVHVGCSEL